MSITTQQAAFVSDLLSLLERYGAFITAKDHYQGYPECGEDVRITVEFSDWSVGDIDLSDYFGNGVNNAKGGV